MVGSRCASYSATENEFGSCGRCRPCGLMASEKVDLRMSKTTNPTRYLHFNSRFAPSPQQPPAK